MRRLEFSDAPVRECLKLILARDEGQMVHLDWFGSFLSWFGPLDSMMYVRVVELCKEVWFHGDISTPEATAKLTGLPAGSFLIRFSTSFPGKYTISRLFHHHGNPTVQHARITYMPGKGYVYNGS